MIEWRETPGERIDRITKSFWNVHAESLVSLTKNNWQKRLYEVSFEFTSVISTYSDNCTGYGPTLDDQCNMLWYGTGL